MASFYKKCNIGLKLANPFLDTVLLLFHLKTSKNLEVFCLRGEEKESFCLKSVKISSAGYLSLFIMELLKVSHETYVECRVNFNFMNQKVYWNMKQDVQYALDNHELFLRNGWPTKGVKPYFHLGPLSKIFTIANLRHAANRF